MDDIRKDAVLTLMATLPQDMKFVSRRWEAEGKERGRAEGKERERAEGKEFRENFSSFHLYRHDALQIA